MRIPILVFAVVAIASAGMARAGSESAGDGQVPMTVALAVPQSQGRAKAPDVTGLRRYAAACGICSDVDCCGGSENGWKLCQSDCPSGQYKCEQVAECD